VIIACEKGGISYCLTPEPKLKIWGAPSLGADVVEYLVPEHWMVALGELSRHFVDAVQNGTTPPVTGEDNYRVMEIIDATYQSAREGRKVAIEQHPV
jgi:predicted dehydrogenase